MEEEGGVENTMSSFGVGAPVVDRSVQEFRLNFDSEIQQLRLMATGKAYVRKGGKLVEEVLDPDAPLCQTHFQKLLVFLYPILGKNTALTNLNEERALMYITDLMNSFQAWVTSQALNCPKCKAKSFNDLVPLIDGVETFVFTNMFRGVEGWEGKLLSTMQNVTTREVVAQPEKKRLFGLFKT